MNTKLKVAALAALGAVTLAACGVDTDDNDCDTSVIYFGTDHHYHYGSPTGKTVPAYKVPSSARKVPGYKPVGPAKPPANLNKGGGSKPGYKAPAPKPAAPKPAPMRRR